jgi:predicted transcriptional regulator
MALTVRTDKEMEAALTAMSEREGTSRQEIIRRSILERFERSGHEQSVHEATTAMLDKWGDVLRRLAEA